MNDPVFFGYGSLVNRATHGYPDARPARLEGWRRVWRHTDVSDKAFLTAVPAVGAAIDGLVARVPNGDWAALDLRESGYDRVQSGGISGAHGPLAAVAVYSIPHDKHGAPPSALPILLSYVDVVVQGFLREFGTDGVARFFATTDGWDAPVQNDRAAPGYPRHQTLSPAETALVDRHLSAVGARVIPR